MKKLINKFFKRKDHGCDCRHYPILCVEGNCPMTMQEAAQAKEVWDNAQKNQGAVHYHNYPNTSYSVCEHEWVDNYVSWEDGVYHPAAPMQITQERRCKKCDSYVSETASYGNYLYSRCEEEYQKQKEKKRLDDLWGYL